MHELRVIALAKVAMRVMIPCATMFQLMLIFLLIFFKFYFVTILSRLGIVQASLTLRSLLQKVKIILIAFVLPRRDPSGQNVIIS